MRKILLLMLIHCLLQVQISARALAQSPVKKAEKAESVQGVTLKQEAGKVNVLVEGQPFTTYYFDGYNKPVFSPLRAATGTIVTRGYPMISDVPGEAKDHPHHKGLWFTHGDVNGVDFWSESDKTGKIVHRKFLAVNGGSKTGVLQSENEWVATAGETLLKEIREVRIHSLPGVRVMDFDVKLTAVNGPVKFGDTKEGSFGIRLAQPFSDKSGGRMENSRGGQSEAGCWGKAAEWVNYTAKINGEALGIAIFDHPTSFRHPTHWHVRGYCLFAVNPFGLQDFYNDKAKDGSHTLKKGESASFRYRVYIHPGSAQEGKIAEQYKAYAEGVRFKK
ncbi:MAG: PmoA family protein [Acidobacteria bacterium]|nr:PmoA family protein [Acidobacteriota bacterium]MCI0628875.1 PmoA family protein [Acidobacteriota bacterium]MCI0718658.1 PmoA family protein [Acidobacteriota bacterium]